MGEGEVMQTGDTGSYQSHGNGVLQKYTSLIPCELSTDLSQSFKAEAASSEATTSFGSLITPDEGLRSQSPQSECGGAVKCEASRTSKHPQFIQVLLGFEFIWRWIFLVISIVGGILVYWIYRFHTDPLTASIPKGTVCDFWVSCAVAGLVAVIRSRSRGWIYPYMLTILADRKKVTEELGRKQADNLCKWVVDIVYYFSSSVTGLWILKDTVYLPTCLFGEGKCENMVLEYPVIKEVDYLRLFYMVQGGKHLHSLLEQMVTWRQEKKFYEYALHHSVALLLIVFSYLTNLIMIGSIVFLVHDISDTALLITRFYTSLQRRNRYIETGLIVVALIIWIYMRNIILTVCLIKTSFEGLYRQIFGTPLHDVIFPPAMFMISMLVILALLHMYWTIFFWHGAISAFTKKRSKQRNE